MITEKQCSIHLLSLVAYQHFVIKHSQSSLARV